MYKSIVCPQLQCASTVWDPVTKSIIAKSESIQRSAARFCCIDYCQTNSVTSKLQVLQSRQGQNTVTMMYRIMNNLVEIPSGQYLSECHGHSNKRTSSRQPANILFYQHLRGILFSINSPPLPVNVISV